MAQDGEININKVKAEYSLGDFKLVDIREIHFANELRLYFEISFGIGLTLLGVLIMNFSWPLFGATALFLAFGIFNLVRYLVKTRRLRSTNRTNK